MRRLINYVVGLAVIVALGYGAWAKFWPHRPPPHEQTFQAELTTMEDVLVVAGLVKPAVTIDLRAEASGIVEFVGVKEGDRVVLGQELVRLDSDATEVLPASVQSVSMAGDIDQATRLTTFPVVVALDSQPPGGWVNVPAQAEIVLSATITSVSLPERCVRSDPAGRSYVTVRTQMGNRSRTVEIGVIQKDRIQIRNGLEAGQTVVCRPS